MLKCPRCGNTDLSDIRFIEDIQCWREIDRFENGVLYINGLYKSGEGYDEGANPRFECQHTSEDTKQWCGYRWKAVLKDLLMVEWI